MRKGRRLVVARRRPSVYCFLLSGMSIPNLRDESTSGFLAPMRSGNPGLFTSGYSSTAERGITLE